MIYGDLTKISQRLCPILTYLTETFNNNQVDLQGYLVLRDYSGFVHFSYEYPVRLGNRTIGVNLRKELVRSRTMNCATTNADILVLCVILDSPLLQFLFSFLTFILQLIQTIIDSTLL